MENFIAPDDDVIRPIVLVRIRNVETGASEMIYAMLDTCADKDVISENIVKRLNLTYTTKTMTVQTVETKMTQKRRLANFQLESIHSSYKTNVGQALVAKLWSSDNDIPPAKRDLTKFNHLDGIKFDDEDVEVGMIISVAHADTWTQGPFIRGPKKSPTALLTFQDISKTFQTF